jgi:Zn-dependent peptidase ImmA (M78 family)
MHQASLEPKQVAAPKKPSEAANEVRQGQPPALGLRRALGNEAITRLLQTKLRVSEPGDVYEQEADRVADQVMRSVDSGSRASGIQLQRQVSTDDPDDTRDEQVGQSAVTLMHPQEPDDLDLQAKPVIEESLQRQCACEEDDLQRKPALSSPGVSTAPPRVVRRQCACGRDTESSDGECAECKKEHDGSLQRLAASTAKVDGAPPIVHDVLRSSGQPLDRATRAFFEPRFGFNLDGVRVHTDAQAAHSADAVHAHAYTVGQHVVFGQSQFSPESTSGRLLLAHELTHVVQQSKGSPGVQRMQLPDETFETEADSAASRVVAGGPVSSFLAYSGPPLQRKRKADDEPPDSQMFGSLMGFVLEADPNATFAPGPIYPQMQGMELKKYLGSAYSNQVRDKFIAEWGSQPLFETPPGLDKIYTIDPVKGPIAHGGEKFHGVVVSIKALRREMRICAKIGSPFTLPPELQIYLELGEAAEFAYPILGFPKWFTKEIFTTLMSNRAKLLSELSQILKQDPNPMGMDSPSINKVGDIYSSLQVSVYALENIRSDAALVSHPVYQNLWPSQQKQGEKAAPTVADANRSPATIVAAGFLSYADARPILAHDASKSSEARKQLLDSYGVASKYRHVTKQSEGNQSLSDVPTVYTAPPYPATLSMYPNLQNSLYGSTRSEYGFNMALEFPNIFSSFQFHSFDFAAYRVPDDKFVNMAKALKGPGRGSSHWDMLKSRLARDKRYEEADIRAYANTLWDQFGPPGNTADLIHLNSAMRSFGTIVGTAFEAFADPSYTARFTFQDEGLYVVRCTAEWNPGQEITLKRPPSVAYQPLFAREPELLAELQLQMQVSEIEEARKRLPKVLVDISKTKDPKRLEELEKERKQLEALVGGVGGLLKYQKDLLDSSGGKDAAARADRIQDIIDTRKARGFDQGAERLPAVYVSDSGQVLDLLIEVSSKSIDPVTGVGDFTVNDATTASSTSATATGKRHDAVVQALKDLFKASDYGRGKASVLIDGVLEPIDVPTVSVGKLFMEAAANTATLLSIIAIAAAPFTGGASMSLMVPAMIIGAVPSGYNIVTRGIDHTLHFDLPLAMEVVNIVGAAVGAGSETRAGMEAIRLGTAGGRVLIVTGLGVMGASVLLMSDGVLEQLEAVQNIPEGLRGAEVMKILGHFMLNAGIMVGGILASQARARGELGPLTFEDWLGELDTQTRERLMASKTEVATGKNFWKIYSEMDPAVRDLLTQCGSTCIPMDPPPSKADQARIRKLAESLSPKVKRTLKGLLHDNRESVALDAVLSAIEEARDKAPKSKGGARKAAAVEQAILARGTGADYILANFSEEPVEALDKTNPGKWKRARQLADDIAKAGNLELEAVGRVMDNVRRTEGADPEELLGYLKNLSDFAGKVDGIDRIMGPDGLGGTYTRFKGARWTMKFLTEAGLWKDVRAFEEPVPGALIDRVVDVRLNDGTRVELKSWQSWHDFADVGFSRQIMADWLPTHGLQDPIVWAFEPGSGIGKAQDVIQKMSAALDKALQEKWRGYDDAFAARRVQAIKDKLPQIVRVGPK